jgi:uncharacterized tellurite resistance protein B-like protein
MVFLFLFALVGGFTLFVWLRSPLRDHDDSRNEVGPTIERQAPAAPFTASERRRPIAPPPVPVVPKVAPDHGTATGLLVYDITYEDSSANRTRRRVRVESVQDWDDVIYVGAWCELRGNYRTFRADRIVELVDVSTGEVFSDPLRHFAAMDLRSSAAGAPHQAAVARARPGLVALSHIARADGETSEAEVEVLFDWLRFKAGPDAHAINPVIARLYINGLRATFGDAAAAIDRLPKKDSSAFDEFAGRMVVANGAADPAAEKRRQRLRKGIKGL